MIRSFFQYLGAKKTNLYFYPDIVSANKIHLNDYWIKNVHGLYYPNKESQSIVIVCHGNAGSVYNRRHLSAAINDMGHSCYLLEYPGFGKTHQQTISEEQIIKSALTAIKHWDRKYQNLILYGESIGCTIATKLASIYSFPKIILQSGPCSISDMIYHFTSVPLLGYVEYCFNSEENIKELKGEPKIYILHSKTDEIVPYEQSLKLSELLRASGKTNSLIKIKGSHNAPRIPWGRIL